jgi:DNA invertase Pin-like site-specific DNA recombinase
LSTTVAFLAETPGSATIEEQKASLGPNDFVVLAGRRNFNQLGELLARNGMALKPGDCVKVFDLSCLAISTTTLIRVLTKLLRAGISVEVVVPKIVIKPDGMGKPHALLDALDGHYRHVHGIKTHPANTAPQGRKPLLDVDQLPAIRTMLAKPGSTATKVAKQLGVGRSTLFNYLERFNAHHVERGQKVIQRRSKNMRDDSHIPERDIEKPTG